MESSNPTLKGDVFSNARAVVGSGQTMTIQGTINKTFILLAVLLLVTGWSWNLPMGIKASILSPIPCLIIFGICMAIGFVIYRNPSMSPVLAPLYTAVQGVFVGVISSLFEQRFPGIVIQAVGLTFAVLFVMLIAYRTGWIQATPMFRKCLFIATGAIMLFYFVVLVAGAFGIHPPGFLYQGSMLGIGISLFVVGIATLNLILDFDLIERASQEGLEKYMEWYGAFALMATLIWLYMEILNLLQKLNRRN
jgi:uncharacterized YccA/Bax inhibitor family protein